MTNIDTSTPVVLLGGSASTVAVARNLGRLGVHITASGPRGCRSMNSKYCRKALPVPPAKTCRAYWSEMLLTDQNRCLTGSVVLAGCDEAVEFVEDNRNALRERYILDEGVPELRRAMLDKQATIALARRAGVPAPHYWPIHADEDVFKIRGELRFPIMVKPLNSQAFENDFGRKLFIIEDDIDEVAEKVALSRSRGHEVMVVEMIPGPDSLLSGYYIYQTPDGRRLYEYTKSIIRRWPVNRGGATFHQSEWLPETAEMGRKLFDGIGWQGFANVEFKRDTRDGKLKIIEVNVRFTAPHRLVTEAGMPIDVIIYCHLTGQPVPTSGKYSQTLRMWDPFRDFLAFRQLNRRGQLSFRDWLKSVAKQKFILPYFSVDDPGPTLAEIGATISRGLRNPNVLWRKTSLSRRAGQNAN